MSKNETVALPNGTQLTLTRPGSIDDKEWAQVKEWLVQNPQKATVMQQSVKEMTENPMKVEQFREVMALAEVMKNDPTVPSKFQALATDAQFAGAFNEMKTGGMEAVMKYYNDEGFLRAVSQKNGWCPQGSQDSNDEPA